MKMNLLGIKTLDFTSADKTQIKGVQLFVSFEDEGVIGQRTDKLFLKDGFTLPALKPGDVLDVTYNRHGKPESIRVLTAKQINISSQ